MDALQYTICGETSLVTVGTVLLVLDVVPPVMSSVVSYTAFQENTRGEFWV